MSDDPNFLVNLNLRLQNHKPSMENTTPTPPSSTHRGEPLGQVHDFAHASIQMLPAAPASTTLSTALGYPPLPPSAANHNDHVYSPPIGHDFPGRRVSPVHSQNPGFWNMNVNNVARPTSMGGHPPPSPASLPSMTAGASRSPSGGPITPTFDPLADAIAQFLQPNGPGCMTDIGDPYLLWLCSLTDWLPGPHQLVCLDRLLLHGTITPDEIVRAALDNGMPTDRLFGAPPLRLDHVWAAAHAQIIITYGGGAPSLNAHTDYTGGVQRTIQTRQHRQLGPYDTPTTNQAAAAGAVLVQTNNTSTVAARAGRPGKRNAGGKASSSTRSANTVAGPSSAANSTHTLVRAGTWRNAEEEEKMEPEGPASLDRMYQLLKTKKLTLCLFPGCKKGVNPFSTPQKFEQHVFGQHLKTLPKSQCPICDEWYAVGYSLKVHMRRTDKKAGCKGRLLGEEPKGKGKQKAEPEEEDGAVDVDEENVGYGRQPENDDDDAGAGGMTGMFTTGAFDAPWVF